MTGRLIVLSLFTLFAIAIGAIPFSLDNETSLFVFAPGMIGVVAIGYVIWSHVRFRRANHFLVFEQPFRPARSVDLNELESWQELGYNIRGQRRRSLLLFQAGKPCIVIDNGTYADEFLDVHSFLKENLPDKETS